MEKEVLKKIKKENNEKNIKKVFTNIKGKDIIKKSFSPSIMLNKRQRFNTLEKKEWIKMKDMVIEETEFIDEKTYQQIKKNMCKSDDYFTQNEFEKIGVI